MLATLSGRVHEVWTGIFLFDPARDRGLGEAVRSIVKFAPLTADEIEDYVATGEPLDKAGAYAVQGYGAAFVEAIEGSYTNVVGLPLGHLRHLLRLARGEVEETA
jgi:septum formation protein